MSRTSRELAASERAHEALEERGAYARCTCDRCGGQGYVGDEDACEKCGGSGVPPFDPRAEAEGWLRKEGLDKHEGAPLARYGELVRLLERARRETLLEIADLVYDWADDQVTLADLLRKKARET